MPDIIKTPLSAITGSTTITPGTNGNLTITATGQNDRFQVGDKVYTTDVMCDSVQNYQPKGSVEHTEFKNGDSFTKNDFSIDLGIDADRDLPF